MISEKIKKLQELYCWSVFYKENNRVTDYEKIQIEIKEYKEKNKLN